MEAIKIVGKRRGTIIELDEAKNSKEAKSQLHYWRQLKPDWKISTQINK